MLDDMASCKNTAIIVAAGNGSRLGSDKPKQFLLLAGREILSYSVQTFLNHPRIDDVIIVTSTTFLDHVSVNYPECRVILGGDSRQDSVFNGISACSTDSKIVLVHDAARPLIPVQVIDDCLKKLETFDGTAPAIKPADTIVQLKGKQILNLNREDLRIVQTPQCFHIDILRQAHASGMVDTDEMGLVKQANPGARLGYIDGTPETMKITKAVDLEIVQLFLKTI